MDVKQITEEFEKMLGLTEEEKKEPKSGELDKVTKYYNAFKVATDKLSQDNEDTNNNGINKEELEKITGQEIEEDKEYLTPAQKSLGYSN